MSNLAASNTNPLQESIHRAFSNLFSLVRKFLTGLLSFCLLLSKYIRRTLSFIKRNLNLPKEILPSTRALASYQSSSLFLSLPRDIILNCLARVPRQNYPILSHVSKSFQSFVLSPDLRQMRFLIGKDYPVIYICFVENKFIGNTLDKKFHWFSFDPNEKKTSNLNSIRIISQEKLLLSSSVSIGSKIYFVGGFNYNSSRSLWVFNSLTGELCEGPSMKIGRRSPGVAVVNGKLYVMGDFQDEIRVEVFDPKTQAWEVGPHREIQRGLDVRRAVSVEDKVYGMSYGNILIYDTKDGRSETLEMPNEEPWRRCGVCVINNVLYVYYTNRCLMWYDSKDKLWRTVKGLNMLIIYDWVEKVAMVDCKGKLGFLWEERNTNNKRIWCEMIVLDRNGVEICGAIEWSVFVGYVPKSYDIWDYVGVFD